jgi:ABC-2 type transport system ATP-binding protein
VSYAYPGQSGGVRDVSLAAEPGALYALIGENGAGKTTLMRLMLGLLTPTSGEVLVGGAPLRRDPALLASIGSLIETPSLYLHLTGEEHLRVFAIYYGLGRTAVGRALETVGLGAAAATLVKRYSLGMKQRLGIATALLHEPAILVLDEPMNGLDPAGMAELRELLAGLAARGKTVIVSSHLLSEVERSASRIAIIHRGALRFEGRPEEFRRSRGSGAGVLLRVADAPAAVLQLEAGGHVCATQGDAVVVRDVPESQVGDLVRALAAAGHDIRSVETVRPSLEDEYLALLREAPDA